eukprot:m.109829 g.109829  ORF g.109829 m.109829 type:complete len:339 (-) comp15903_c0_seq2:2275-3291(-)
MATLEQPAFWNADTLALAKTVPTHTAFAALVTRLAPDRAAAELLARHMAACVLGDVDAASTVILYNGRQSGKRTYAWLLHRLMWLLGRPCHLEKGNDTLAVSMNGRQLLVATSTLPPRWVQTDPSKVVIHANADFPSPSSSTAYSGSSASSIGSIGSSNTSSNTSSSNSSSNSSSSNLLDASKPYVLASAVATAPRHEIISFLAQFVPARDTVRPQYHTPPAGPSASASLTPPSSIAAATAAAAATTMSSSSSTMTAGLPMASHRHSAPYSLSGSSSSASSSASSSSYHHHAHAHTHHTHNMHSHLGHHAHPHAHPSHSHAHGHGPSRHRSLAVPAAI